MHVLEDIFLNQTIHSRTHDITGDWGGSWGSMELPFWLDLLPRDTDDRLNGTPLSD